MNVVRTSGLLLRLYPPSWRARYGEELEALIVEASGGQRVPWRIRADVALAGARERLRASGLTGGVAPEDRVRSGTLLVLWAWALFVVAGLTVQKFSEHWQRAMPASGRGLASTAFGGLVIAAVCGSLLVVAGIALALPSVASFLHAGGWPVIRRRVVTAMLATTVAAAATVTLVIWGHDLSTRQRNGSDAGYATAFVVAALLAAVCLFAWTVLAVTTARRLRLTSATLRMEAWIACAVSLAMGVMTAATTVWWAAIANSAPWFLAGAPAGTHASSRAPQMVVATSLMVLATLLGAAGARRAVRNLPTGRQASPAERNAA